MLAKRLIGTGWRHIQPVQSIGDGMITINDYNVYSFGMKKSIKDKLFFEGLVEHVDTIIDFGCADGQILKQLHRDFPEWKLIGIDADQTMLELAKYNCNNAEYICAKGIPVDKLKNNSSNALLNLSSVVHEVYSYSCPNEVSSFWENVFACGCKYIAIRDLMLSIESDRESDINDRVGVLTNTHLDALHEFTSLWGSIKSQKNLLHFLMKYRYRENWHREVRENYFPITVEQLLSMIPTDKYRVVYFSHYILPFNRNKILEDFGIELKDNTHVKVLLERK